jgi:hypothetical protein
MTHSDPAQSRVFVQLCVTSCPAQLSRTQMPVSSATGGGAPRSGNQGGRALEGGSGAPGGRCCGSAGPADEGDQPALESECSLHLNNVSPTVALAWSGAHAAPCKLPA